MRGEVCVCRKRERVWRASHIYWGVARTSRERIAARQRDWRGTEGFVDGIVRGNRGKGAGGRLRGRAVGTAGPMAHERRGQDLLF